MAKFPMAPFIFLQYSLRLPFPENLAPKQKKAKAKNWWNRLAKAGSKYLSLPENSASSSTNVQLQWSYHPTDFWLTFFCFTILCHIFYFYCKKKKKLTFKYFINLIGFPALVCIPKHHREHDFNGKLMHQLATIWGHIWKKGDLLLHLRLNNEVNNLSSINYL